MVARNHRLGHVASAFGGPQIEIGATELSATGALPRNPSCRGVSRSFGVFYREHPLVGGMIMKRHDLVDTSLTSGVSTGSACGSSQPR